MNLNVALETFDELDFDTQNVFVEILNNRLREKKRDYIFKSYTEAKHDFANGILTPETPEEFFKRMDDELTGKF